MLSDEELKIIEENLKNMNEKEYRQYLFGLALQLGRGGQKYVVDKFHISHNTLKKAKIEVQNNDLYIEGDKIRKVNKEKFLTDDEINRIKVSVEKMNEKERRQYLFTELKKLNGKRGSIKFFCEVFEIDRRTLNRAKKDLEENDIWNNGLPIRRKKLDKNGETRIVTSQNDKKEFVIDCDVKERSINFNRNEIKETALSDENQGKYSPHDREISDNYSTSTDLSHEITETDKPDKFSTSTVLASENTKAEEPDKSSESTILASENTETEETNNLIKLSTPSEFEQRDCFNAIEIENIKITLMGLNEKQRREFLYLKSREIKNGIIYIAKNFCISTRTLYRAKRDILNNKFCMTDHNRIRVEGGGRKKKEEKTPNIKIILKEIIDPSTYGDPNSELRWTSFSLRKLKTELAKSLIKTSHTTISRLLKDMGISRKKNKKYHQVGKESPFREHQFLFIQSNTEVAKEQGIPVISIDCMKKILLGNYSNSGTIYTLKDQNILTNDHDFVNDDHKISPFGIYCLNNNTGFINLGQSHDTSQFASNSIISWWINLGQYQFNDAREILVLCDTGGSNRSAGQMWKENLYIASEVLKLKINVCHYPTGCSKYNPIEHRMFSYIAINWQGIPLENIDLVANLICGTTTSSGLFIKCSIDKNRYELNNKLFTKEEFRELPIFYNEWLPKWNYAININKFS